LAEKPVAKAPKWYDRVSFRGYTQFRYHAVLDDDGAGLNVPNDRSVSTTESFMLRRARLILSGDVTDHLYIYLQPDFNASPSDGQYSAQLRDVYADVSFDSAKEYRIRLGQSKVPFGFSNLQSSQNRAALERPDALNSAVEGERDIGAFFYWAPAEVREQFRHLVSSGLKGSGDYGVAGFGLYSGQGLNRSDRNGDPHMVARLSYPFELPRKQVLELGVQGYTGRFVVDTESVANPVNPATTVRPAVSPNGVADERVGFTAVLYPQPFGFEAEWTVGRGPGLSSDFRSIDADFLQGGYIQLNYKAETPLGTGSRLSDGSGTTVGGSLPGMRLTVAWRKSTWASSGPCGRKSRLRSPTRTPSIAPIPGPHRMVTRRALIASGFSCSGITDVEMSLCRNF
jgi:hypothetical protein